MIQEIAVLEREVEEHHPLYVEKKQTTRPSTPPYTGKTINHATEQSATISLGEQYLRTFSHTRRCLRFDLRW